MAAVAVIGGAAGACGSDGALDGLTPHEVVVGAATTTTEANTSKFTFDVSIANLTAAAGTAPAAVNVSGAGAFDYERRRGSMKTTIPAGTSKATLDSVVIGSTVYQKLPEAYAAVAPAGLKKPWIKIDFATLGSVDGINLGTVVAAQASDPSQAVAFLRGASERVDELGEEKLRGDDVQRYRFTIDAGKAAAVAPEAQREALRQVAGVYGSTAIPADAWVDGAGRLRKLTYTLDRDNFPLAAEESAGRGGTGRGGAGGAAQAKVTTTVELFDFGTDVDARPPPPGQVSDFNEWARNTTN
jgi:hypothetical protein